MTRIQQLEESVRRQYAAKNPNRAEWADWLSENHVLVVANNASQLAKRFGGNEELARAAALLHDVADTVMDRFADEHEEASLEIARKTLRECGFSDADIGLVVDDAIRYHSCHDGRVPQSLEGKILATADSLAHLNTDFYIFATWGMGRRQQELADVKA
ncbi:MAG TPA: HD domain-containing protein [Candidatus Saccharimonadales bacterium]|nr:HD domain-containing protein [Candidatus Saccharimonadales bacterium]